MTMRGRTRTFSAALTPAGAYVVGYRSGAGRVEVLQYGHQPLSKQHAAEAARVLGDLVESLGGRGSRLSLAVSGFGGYHHILTLPGAPRAVLLPVISRELRRFFPDVFDDGGEEPIIDYAEIDSAGLPREGVQRELLTAAVPRSLIRTVGESLAARRIELEHWTILPRALQRLYDSFADDGDTTAAVLLAPGASLLGFFHAGELRLFSDFGAAAPEEPEPLVERLERGALYLRQQFTGAVLQRVLLAAEEGPVEAQASSALRERLGLTPEPFGPYSRTPGAMLALSAALDSRADDSLNLLPHELRPPSRHDRLARRLGIASMAVVVAAAAWWAMSGLRAEAAAEERFQQARASLESHATPFARVRQIVEARQGHAQRAELLKLLLGGREQLPTLLWPLESLGPGIRIDGLELAPREGGWVGTLTGTATGVTTAEAASAIDRLYRTLRSELSTAHLSVDEMSPPESVDGSSAGAETSAPIAIRFKMSLIVPAVEEEPQ